MACALMLAKANKLGQTRPSLYLDVNPLAREFYCLTTSIYVLCATAGTECQNHDPNLPARAILIPHGTKVGFVKMQANSAFLGQAAFLPGGELFSGL